MTVRLILEQPCPTCGGTGEVGRTEFLKGTMETVSYKLPCIACFNGTVRVAVSCASCLWAERQGDFGDLVCTEPDHNGEGVMSTFGCTDWTSSSDAALGAIDSSGRVTVDRARFERLLRVATSVHDDLSESNGYGDNGNLNTCIALDALQPGDLEPLG